MGALDFLKKTPGLARMGLILVLGIALLIFASSGAGEKKTEDAQSDLAEYGAALEERLGAFCEQVEGVGPARVMITFESGSETRYQGGAPISVVPPRVLGVTVLCGGSGDATVRARLSEMLEALLGIGASYISILPLA